MKLNKNLILNSKINEVITAIGHFQKIIICDAGFPIPLNVNVIDISLTKNIPSFLDVYKLIIQELDIEKIILATEIKFNNDSLNLSINFLSKKYEINVDYISHNKLKELSENAYCFIKTGESSVYANCIIEAGAHFKVEV